MLVLGVTGQSGAGKGELCNIMEQLGACCLDTDKTAREVVLPGTQCLSELVAHFGNEILCNDGTMDRKKVASIVFSDREELEFLTTTTHKYIIEKIKQWLFERELSGDKIVIIDAPQLFDAGADFYCNFKLCVLADKEIRADRIMTRDGISYDEAMARINSQKDDEYFRERCDYVVYNNGNLEKLKKNTIKIYDELMSKKEYFDDVL
ncbi:MAG: dephospho-CoA kinase [Clostridia bacterium]|nr:dephospho-CoA kinase [Clostridia bacterium]